MIESQTVLHVLQRTQSFLEGLIDSEVLPSEETDQASKQLNEINELIESFGTTIDPIAPRTIAEAERKLQCLVWAVDQCQEIGSYKTADMPFARCYPIKDNIKLMYESKLSDDGYRQQFQYNVDPVRLAQIALENARIQVRKAMCAQTGANAHSQDAIESIDSARAHLTTIENQPPVAWLEPETLNSAEAGEHFDNLRTESPEIYGSWFPVYRHTATHAELQLENES